VIFRFLLHLLLYLLLYLLLHVLYADKRYNVFIGIFILRIDKIIVAKIVNSENRSYDYIKIYKYWDA